MATLTVNYLADKLGLIGNSLECTQISTNKYKMRQAFQANKVSVPKFIETSKFDTNTLEQISKMNLPIIVKPTDRSGSRSITKIEKLDGEELQKAIEEAISVSFEKKAIIEEYIEGEEFSAESISYRGKHTLLTVTRKQTTGAPHFIETGHIQPAGLDEETMKKIEKEVFAGLNSLKIENGASHAEFKITPNGEIKIIEIGARMGGDCIGSDLVQIEKIRKESPEYIFYVSPIEEINSHKIIDSSTRYGYYILAI